MGRILKNMTKECIGCICDSFRFILTLLMTFSSSTTYCLTQIQDIHTQHNLCTILKLISKEVMYNPNCHSYAVHIIPHKMIEIMNLYSNQHWLSKNNGHNICCIFYACEIIGTLAASEDMNIVSQLFSIDLLSIIIHLLNGEMSWIERTSAVRAIYYLSRCTSKLHHFVSIAIENDSNSNNTRVKMDELNTNVVHLLLNEACFAVEGAVALFYKNDINNYVKTRCLYWDILLNEENANGTRDPKKSIEPAFWMAQKSRHFAIKALDNFSGCSQTVCLFFTKENEITEENEIKEEINISQENQESKNKIMIDLLSKLLHKQTRFWSGPNMKFGYKRDFNCIDIIANLSISPNSAMYIANSNEIMSRLLILLYTRTVDEHSIKFEGVLFIIYNLICSHTKNDQNNILFDVGKYGLDIIRALNIAIECRYDVFYERYTVTVHDMIVESLQMLFFNCNIHIKCLQTNGNLVNNGFSCAICGYEQMRFPITLQKTCNHSFCFSCLSVFMNKKIDKYQKREFKCPLCRTLFYGSIYDQNEFEIDFQLINKMNDLDRKWLSMECSSKTMEGNASDFWMHLKHYWIQNNYQIIEKFTNKMDEFLEIFENEFNKFCDFMIKKYTVLTIEESEKLLENAENERIAGNLEYKNDNYLQAIAKYKRALSICPFICKEKYYICRLKYYSNLALSYMKIQQYSKAFECLLTTLVINIYNTKCYVNGYKCLQKLLLNKNLPMFKKIFSFFQPNIIFNENLDINDIHKIWKILMISMIDSSCQLFTYHRSQILPENKIQNFFLKNDGLLSKERTKAAEKRLYFVKKWHEIQDEFEERQPILRQINYDLNTYFNDCTVHEIACIKSEIDEELNKIGKEISEFLVENWSENVRVFCNGNDVQSIAIFDLLNIIHGQFEWTQSPIPKEILRRKYGNSNSSNIADIDLKNDLLFLEVHRQHMKDGSLKLLKKKKKHKRQRFIVDSRRLILEIVKNEQCLRYDSRTRSVILILE